MSESSICSICGDTIPASIFTRALAREDRRCSRCFTEEQRTRDYPHRREAKVKARKGYSPRIGEPETFEAVEITLAVWWTDRGWIWGVIDGGVTGHEQHYWEPDPRTNETYRRIGHWSFCAGTPGRWASLAVISLALDPILDEFADHVAVMTRRLAEGNDTADAMRYALSHRPQPRTE